MCLEKPGNTRLLALLECRSGPACAKTGHLANLTGFSVNRLVETFAAKEFGSLNSIRTETLLVNNQVFETSSLSHQENARERIDEA